jgi:FkbM family methyltransferase
MEQVFSAVGTVERQNGEVFVRTRKSEQGCVVYGPYQGIGRGRYTVSFQIAPDAGGSDGEVCCVLDVAVDLTVVLQRPVTLGELRASKGRVELTFEVPSAGKGEYRVFSTGAVGLRVAHKRTATAILDTDVPGFAAIGSSATERARRLYQDAYPELSFLAEHGATVEVGERIVATVQDIRVHVDGGEDIQVLTEVFFSNDYAFVCPEACIVIDVGMNVGMASLAFAKTPAVKRVFAYEPFRAPFGRAAQNFALNPGLAAKIQPFNVGLGDRDAKLTIMADDLATIGTSVRGNPSGRIETITIKDASEALAPILAEAKAGGRRVIMKVDCEGSEFAIFDSLSRSGLFSSIDAVVMEWHKWWSADKTQEDLIAPLRRAGFLTFDRTNLTNSLTGFLVAVRMAG